MLQCSLNFYNYNSIISDQQASWHNFLKKIQNFNSANVSMSKIEERMGFFDSDDSSSSNDTDECIATFSSALDSVVDDVRCLRKSSRHRKNISYNENGSDDEIMSPPKKAHKNKSSSDNKVKGAAVSKIESKLSSTYAVNIKGNVKSDVSQSDFDLDDLAEKTVYECPDTEFYDFDKDKEEHCFAVGQIWALYDTIDSMPRFYALIKKVFKPGFQLRINMLEADPTDESKIAWAENLPVGCGRFRWGTPEMTSDRLSFSNQLQYEKGMNITSVVIYPRKAEVWALFNDWDINWSSQTDKHKKFKYKIVEVVSDFSENDGIRVSYLEKVRAFFSLFQRVGLGEMDFLVIPPNEMLRFSHRIPSSKMLGNEREGVPEGSFELDPASFPLDPNATCCPMNTNGDGCLLTRSGKKY